MLSDTQATPKAADRMLNLTNSQYNMAEAVVSLLKPFEVTTTIWSADKSTTILCVIPMVLELAATLEEADDDSVAISHFKARMLADMKKCFSFSPFEVSFEITASVMDPRFHHLDELKPEGHERVFDKD